MARTRIQAATLAVSLTANSAQFSAALDAAKAAAQKAQSSINSAFAAIGAGGQKLGQGLGAVKNAFASIAPQASMALVGMAAYTAAVIANRSEMIRLAQSYNITIKEASGFSQVLAGTGIELEDLLDGMKEFGIKAQEALAAGGDAGSVVAQAFKTANIDMNAFLREGDATKRLMMIKDIKDALESAGYSASEVVNVFDEMGGDAGLRMFGVLKQSKEQLMQMVAVGQQIGGSINYDNITDLQVAAGQFIRISNDFLVGIVSRIAPLMTTTISSWTQNIIDMLEKRGGGSIEEGFKSYIKEWADTIFNLVTFVFEGMASMFDGIRNLVNKAVDAYNMVGNTPMKKYSARDLSEEDRKKDKANDQAIVDANQANAKYELALSKSSAWNTYFNDDELDALKADYEAKKALADQAYESRREFNLKNDTTYDPNKSSKGAADMVQGGRDLMTKFDSTVDTSTPGGTKPPNTKPVLGFQTGSGGLSAELAALDNIANKVKDQREKIHNIVKKYNSDERSEAQKKTDAEMEELRDAYQAGRKIITDAYEDRIRAADGNSEAIKDLKRQENEALLTMSKEQARDEAIVIAAQRQRQLEESNEFIRKAKISFEQQMRKYRGVNGGTAGAKQAIKDEIKDLENEWDEKLKAEEKASGKASEQYKLLLEQKKQALLEYHEWERQQINAQGEGISHQMMRMYSAMTQGTKSAYGGMSSVIEGYSNQDIINAQDRSDTIKGNDEKSNQLREAESKRSQMAQVSIMMDGTSQVLDIMAKHNKKAFYLKKAMSIAEILINGAVGVSEALKMGPIMGPVMAGVMGALTGAQLGIVASQQYQGLSGQAHDGIDNIPNEGTWRLDKGERVVSSSVNKDLKQGLKKINGGKVGNTTIDAPVIIQGSVIDQGAVEELLAQHTQHIVKLTEEYKQDRGQ